MAGIFEDIQFQKTDLNTVKELKEDCWRKAQGEDLEAFLGFYLKKKPARSWQIAAWAALFVFLISAGELGFERLCKNDPSYNRCHCRGTAVSVFCMYAPDSKPQRAVTDKEQRLCDRCHCLRRWRKCTGDGQSQADCV